MRECVNLTVREKRFDYKTIETILELSWRREFVLNIA